MRPSNVLLMSRRATRPMAPRCLRTVWGALQAAPALWMPLFPTVQHGSGMPTVLRCGLRPFLTTRPPSTRGSGNLSECRAKILLLAGTGVVFEGFRGAYSATPSSVSARIWSGWTQHSESWNPLSPPKCDRGTQQIHIWSTVPTVMAFPRELRPIMRPPEHISLSTSPPTRKPFLGSGKAPSSRSSVLLTTS